MSILTPSQITSYAQNGYILIKDFFTPSRVLELKQWTQEIHDLPRTQNCRYIPYEEVNAEGKRVLCRTENFIHDHEGYKRLLKDDVKLNRILEVIGGEKMVLFKEKINYKFASAGGFEPHVDRTGYGKFSTGDHLAVNIAIDASTRENGCLEVVDGSHLRTTPIGPDNTIEKSWVEMQVWKEVLMDAGDILIFGSKLAHRSGSNKSTKSRRACYITYNPISEGDNHEAYYEKRAKAWPATHKMVEGVDYSAGMGQYAYGTPMRSVVEKGVDGSK